MKTIRTLRTPILLLFLMMPATSSAGGYSIWEATITDGIAQTIVAAGSLDNLQSGSGISVRGVAKNLTTGAISHFSTSKITYGGSLPWTVTGTDLQIFLNANGSATIQRTAGSDNWELLIRVVWM